MGELKNHVTAHAYAHLFPFDGCLCSIGHPLLSDFRLPHTQHALLSNRVLKEKPYHHFGIYGRIGIAME
jgi:hypothetical protein